MNDRSYDGKTSSATHGVESGIKSKNGAPIEDRQEC